MRLKACVLAGIAALAVTTGTAAPASAAPDTGAIAGDTANSAAGAIGCHVAYNKITVVTVFNPLSPANALVIVSVPTVTGFGCP